MMIDDLQGRLPSMTKWCLAGVGAAAGWHFAQASGSPVPASCIITGAAAGFCLIVVGFTGLRLLKLAATLAVIALIVNYALLIPFGYGNQLPGWIGLLRAFLAWLHGLQLPQPNFGR